MRLSKGGVLAVILVGLASYTFWQRRQIRGLRTERDLLRAQVAEAAAHFTKSDDSLAQLKGAVERWTEERGELMRLRSQSSRVREVEQENAQLRSERQRLGSELAQLRREPVRSEERKANEAMVPLEPGAAVTYLGIVELSEEVPVRLRLGQDKECSVTTTVVQNGQLQLAFSFDDEVDGVPVRSTVTSTLPSGTQFATVINGVDVVMTAVLKAK